MDQSASSPRPLLLTAVTMGLAATLAMWIVGYATHLPGIAPQTIGGKATVGILIALAFAVAMMITGRAAPRGRVARTGAAAGLVAGMLNLMILGSLLSEPPVEGGTAVAPNAGLAALGFLIASWVSGAIFALLGAKILPHRLEISATPDRWHAHLAAIAACCIVPVLLTGGLVTSYDAGLAVPDWPQSYTANMFLFPLAKMTGGIYYEHTHRLFGALAGTGCLLLFLVSVARLIAKRRNPADRRAMNQDAAPLPLGRACVLATIALVVITVQGLLGGYRVIIADGSADVAAWKEGARESVYTGEATASNFALTVDNTTSINLALAHGVSGQLAFAIVVLIAAMLTVRWTRARAEARSKAIPAPPRDGFLRSATAALVITSILQLVLGAATRHHESQLFMIVHIAMGTLVMLVAFAAAFRAMATLRDEPAARLAAKALAAVVIVQFTIGFGAMIFTVPHYRLEQGDQPISAVLAATAHQALGAVYLALAVLTCAWSWRLTASRRRAEAPEGAAQRTTGTPTSALPA